MMPPYAMLLDRCVLEFHGADVVRYLNGQLSNDVKKLTLGTAMHACVMTAKGRMNAEVWLTKIQDGIRLDGPSGLGEELVARFEKYIISDDVSVTDVTGSLALYHATGDMIGSDGIRANRFNLPGFDLWLPTSESPAALSEIKTLTPSQIESFRIEQGIPAWGSELDENTIPVEAGLDHDAIDYHKGCYIGQEVISRIKSVGHVNRHLVRLRVGKDVLLSKGAALYAGGVAVGSITSCAPTLDLESNAALAYLKRNFSAPGTLLTTQPDGGETITILALHP